MDSDTQQTPYGWLPSSLSGDRLADLCLDDGVQTGPFGSQLHQEDYVPIGTPIITVEHLGENRIVHQDLPRVSDEDRQRLAKYSLKTGDIVFSRVGSVDRRAIVRESENGWLFSGRCLRVRPDPEKLDSQWLSYFFGLPAFKQYIRSIAVGATMPSINTKILSDVPIYFPALTEQRSAAKCLTSIDDKIDLNRRINQTLEAMAQAIFKSWFVDFDPVKAKIIAKQEGRDPLRAAMSAISGKPEVELDTLTSEHYTQLAATAALFPDEMEESELGVIPRGWICPGIETLANVKQGKYLGKDEMQDSASAAFPFPVWGGNGILGYSQKFAYSSPVVLMTCRGSNCGLIKHTESAAWVSNNSFACIPKIGSTLFLLTYFQAELFDDCVSGSAQPQITYTSLKTKKLKFPVEPNVCSQFSKLMDSAFSAILSLNKQISELSALRDTLLPKLLSGDLSVADVTSEVNA